MPARRFPRARRFRRLPRFRLSRGAGRPALLIALAAVLLAAPPRLARTDAATVLQWTALPLTTAAPPARSQYGMAADAAGNVYLYGGRAADGTALADFWRLKPGAGAWQPLPNTVVPPLIEPHLAVDAAGVVYEFGGVGDPRLHDFTYDGHSFGLYRYAPGSTDWVNVTPSDAQPGTDWPPGREDHGFAFDAANGLFYVFGGEGTGDAPLGDLWSFNPSNGQWAAIAQQYAGNGAAIDPREIYNISYDNHNGFYLFGGSYLAPSQFARPTPLYVNDLWHFDVASSTWSLIAGQANEYDPSLPVPRHYYAQVCDPDGNFYILGGYVSDSAVPPFFAGDQASSYAHPITLGAVPANAPLAEYALADFWVFNASGARWTDLSNELGDLNGPSIPYVMTDDQAENELLTFGGFHYAPGSGMAVSSAAWIYGLPSESGAMPPLHALPPTPTPAGAPPSPMPTATAPSAPPSTAPSGTPSATPSPSPTMPGGSVTMTATATAPSDDGGQPRIPDDNSLLPDNDDNPPLP